MECGWIGDGCGMSCRGTDEAGGGCVDTPSGADTGEDGGGAPGGGTPVGYEMKAWAGGGCEKGGCEDGGGRLRFGGGYMVENTGV